MLIADHLVELAHHLGLCGLLTTLQSLSFQTREELVDSLVERAKLERSAALVLLVQHGYHGIVDHSAAQIRRRCGTATHGAQHRLTSGLCRFRGHRRVLIIRSSNSRIGGRRRGRRRRSSRRSSGCAGRNDTGVCRSSSCCRRRRRKRCNTPLCHSHLSVSTLNDIAMREGSTRSRARDRTLGLARLLPFPLVSDTLRGGLFFPRLFLLFTRILFRVEKMRLYAEEGVGERAQVLGAHVVAALGVGTETGQTQTVLHHGGTQIHRARDDRLERGC
mmetsp:Transcript_9980/g.30719  ORF Transcript_9980/g.30719 Transcript_9980/m.30719 type:complete len:275 (-) Transcript_9980:421-1245(-)